MTTRKYISVLRVITYAWLEHRFQQLIVHASHQAVSTGKKKKKNLWELTGL